MAFLPRRGCSSSDRDSDTAPLQRRTGSRGPHRGARPEGRTLRLDSSHGVHRFPFADMTVVCVHSRLNRRSGFGPGLPRPRLVPFLPFLPASTVSSAEGGSEDPPFDCLQVCCTLQPAMGFATFPAVRSAPCLGDPKIAATESSDRAFPDGVPPFEAFPSPVACPSSPQLPAFTDVRAFSSLVPRRRLRVATLPPPRFVDLKALLHRRVRSTLETLPSEDARCSLGLLLRPRSVGPTFRPDGDGFSTTVARAEDPAFRRAPVTRC